MLTNHPVGADHSTPLAATFRSLASDAGAVLTLVAADGADGHRQALAELGRRADDLQGRLADQPVKAGQLWLEALRRQIVAVQAAAVFLGPATGTGAPGVRVA